MAGHFFSCRGDITKLACDAWLLPTNANKVIEPYWENQCLKQLGVLEGDFSQYDISADFGGSVKTALPKNWGESPEYPMPILTVVGDETKNDIEWYLDSVDQFLEAFQKELRCYLRFRIRPLVAIPLIGIEKGGGGDEVASIIVGLLIHCHTRAKELDIDIVIVLKNQFHYSVFQRERKRLDKEYNFWPELSEEDKESAKEVANHAKKGELVLFLGAGVSAGAGIPRWGQLLKKLTEKAQFSEAQQKALSQFNFLDQAEILKKELNKINVDINQEIVEMLSSKAIYSLAHALISDWPINETVTQNYDNMFETACRESGYPLSVIPYTFEENSPKWLLKMHGCVTRPDDIVLSRSDYLDYDYSRSALSGIVQALLVTKHMLFLGFSLTDDHFIQLIFGVHKALEGMMSEENRHKFGTVLSPVQSTMQEELWMKELNFVSYRDGNGDFLKALSWHDVFLDYATSLAHTSHSYLFHREYDSLLDEDELILRSGLQEAYDKVKEFGKSGMLRDFEEYLKTLGMDFD